jgi:hypothetical protein
VELVRSASTLGRLLLNCRLLLDQVFFFFTTVFFFAAGRFATTRFFAAPPSTMLFTVRKYFSRITKLIQILSILGGSPVIVHLVSSELVTQMLC